MSLRLACVALVFALSTGIGIAAESDASTTTDTVPANDVQSMTPEQLRDAKARLDRQIAATRDENAAANQRIEELEQRNAELDAKKVDLDTQLADVQARVAALEAERKD